MMTEFSPFSTADFTALFQLWRDCGYEHVGIVMGPLDLALQLDIYRSTINIHAYDAGEVCPSTLEWYESKYTIFHCVYGLMRINGVRNPAWESTRVFDESDLELYEEHLRVYEPHLRVQFPQELEGPFLIENMWSYSYMKLYPHKGHSGQHSAFPSGLTTTWVDSFLNFDPIFCPDLI